jgi:uncharacterized membrane protein
MTLSYYRSFIEDQPAGVNARSRASVLRRPGRGIDFNQTAAPDYGDFAYLSFTIGMTFQVSDTNIGSGQIRAAVSRWSMRSAMREPGRLPSMIRSAAGKPAAAGLRLGQNGA